MSFALWAVILGVLLTTMALSGSLLKRLPLSAAMLAVGVALGTAGWGLMAPSPLKHPVLIEHVTEIAVVISLFSAGLDDGLRARQASDIEKAAVIDRVRQLISVRAQVEEEILTPALRRAKLDLAALGDRMEQRRSEDAAGGPGSDNAYIRTRVPPMGRRRRRPDTEGQSSEVPHESVA